MLLFITFSFRKEKEKRNGMGLGPIACELSPAYYHLKQTDAGIQSHAAALASIIFFLTHKRTHKLHCRQGGISKSFLR